MGYEIEMQARILALLRLFDHCSLDKETHAWVKELVADEKKWPKGHDLFELVRKRLLGSRGQRAACAQYAFEELCLKTVFNETDTEMPFDTNSSFWLAGSAIQYARQVGVSLELVMAVLAPKSD
ncbi:MAG TPA: hypothetical protein VHY09_05575 [Candidatus Methylacidiphilales bacterium]|jgi:hypothetical protein|nr:hypothetical protein [Candidatus Methylacidiphilales bacterium]